jgi:hypothetical protein
VSAADQPATRPQLVSAGYSLQQVLTLSPRSKPSSEREHVPAGTSRQNVPCSISIEWAVSSRGATVLLFGVEVRAGLRCHGQNPDSVAASKVGSTDNELRLVPHLLLARCGSLGFQTVRPASLSLRYSDPDGPDASQIVPMRL